MEQLDRHCEKFTGGPTVAFTERAHVTLDSGGSIYINQKVFVLIGKPRAVFLYFNRPKDMIVIEPTGAAYSNQAFIPRPNKGSTGHIIYANPFCKHFGIKVDQTQRFIDPKVDSIGRLYLKLAETVTVSRGPRSRRKKTQELHSG